jgi:thiosulfate/3-mercaptopyruvate sulfurtransferase
MKKIKLFKGAITLGIFLTIWFQFAIYSSAQELPPKLVTTDWLAKNLSNEKIRIIDMRADIRDYWESHIPEAAYLDPAVLRWTEGGVSGKLVPPAAFVLMLGELGINENTYVIVYSERNSYRATYLIWALDYIGHKSSALLAEGFERWRREGRALTQDYPPIKATQYKLPSKLNTELRATLEEVKKAVDSGDAVILDVRPVDLYTGEKGTWKRRGHIKGAINHFWALDLMEDGSWKSKEELARLDESIGATPDKTILVSCGQGQMASHTYFTLKYILGYPKVKNYDGSYNEWSNIDELPVETGQK